MDEDGGIETNRSWHHVAEFGGDPAALCSGQHFGYGLGALDNENGLDYEEKVGRVTCEKCREIIKEIKQIKL